MRLLLTGLLISTVAGLGATTIRASPPGPSGRSPAPASDRPRGAIIATPRFLPAAGPVLAGDGTVVWVTRRDDAVLDLWEAAVGAAPRRIQRFVGSDTTWLAAPRLAASASAVGLSFAETRAGSARALQTRVYLGEPGQPLAHVSSCAGTPPQQRSFDIEAAATVFAGGRGCRQVTVHPVGAAPGAAHRLPDGAAAPRLAGAYEAWLEGSAARDAPSAAVVRERASGREITRVPGVVLPSAISELALRDDGTLALLYRVPGRSRTTRVALLAPGSTRPRTLAPALLAARSARWVGDMLAVVAVRHTGPRAALLQLVDDRGATVTPVLAMGGRDRDLWGHTDVSTSTAVWVQRGCTQAVIRTLALPAHATARLRAPACALRLRRPVRVRAGRLRLGISCAGFAAGCSARVRVSAGSRLVASGLARPNHSTPPYAAAELRLTRAGRARLAGRPRLSVRISARIGTSAVRRTSRTIVRGST